MDDYGELPSVSEDSEHCSELNVKCDTRLFETESSGSAADSGAASNLPTIASCYTIPDNTGTNLPQALLTESFPADWNTLQDTAAPLPYSTAPICEASTSSAVLLKCPLCTVNTFLAADREGWRMHVKVAHSFLARESVCSLCNISTGDMLRHIEEAHMNLQKYERERTRSQKRFQCSHCDKKFRWRNRLERHIKLAHKKRKAIKCNHCERTFTLKSSLYDHIDRVHENVTWHYCDMCGKRFFSALGLVYHKRNKHVGYGTAQPPQDTRRSLLPDLVMETQRSQENETNGSSSQDQSANLDHFTPTNLPGSRAYQCNHCTASFTLKREVLGHVDEAHVRLMRYVCATCTDFFYTDQGLEVHRRKIHSGSSSSQSGKMKNFSFVGSSEGKKYRCNHCQKPYTLKKEMLHHVDREHVRLKHYTCDRCPQFFFSPGGLKIHKARSHPSTSKKNGSFGLMSQVGASTASVVQSEPSKSGDSDNVPFFYGQREDLSSDNDDLVIVNEVTPTANDNPESHYERAGTRNRCVHCNDTFFRVSEVLEHVDATHMKLVRHQCQICPRYFFKSFGLNCHMERSHGSTSASSGRLPLPPELFMLNQQRAQNAAGNSEKFYCQICGKSFNSAMGLSVHVGHHRRTAKHPVSTYTANTPAISDPTEILIDDDDDPIEIIDAPADSGAEFACFLCDFDCATMAELNAHTDTEHQLG